jgi:hypothetical protein
MSLFNIADVAIIVIAPNVIITVAVIVIIIVDVVIVCNYIRRILKVYISNK